MSEISLSNSLQDVNNFSFNKYSDFIEYSLKTNNQSTIFYYVHLNNFINKFNSKLGLNIYIYLEKLFKVTLELKLIQESQEILNKLKLYLGNKERKIQRMEADLLQVTQTKINDNALDNEVTPTNYSISIYRSLYKANQNDTLNLKNYIYLKKSSYSYDEMNKYIELLNEYLSVYMDDVEIWQELSDVYVSTSNFNKAIFCLEEILLYYPNDYTIYLKIADLFNSFNNLELSQQSLKYYCKSININPTNRAFWGIVYIAYIFNKSKKSIVEYDKLYKCFKIAENKINKSYGYNIVKDLYGDLY